MRLVRGTSNRHENINKIAIAPDQMARIFSLRPWFALYFLLERYRSNRIYLSA